MTAPLTTPDTYSLTVGTDGMFSSGYGAYHRLREGVSMIQVSFEGPGALNIMLSPQADYRTKVLAKTLPAGTGLRSTVLMGVTVAKGEARYLSLGGLGGARAGVVITTFPLAT